LVYAKNGGHQISYFTPKGVFAVDFIHKAGVTDWMEMTIPGRKL